MTHHTAGRISAAAALLAGTALSGVVAYCDVIGLQTLFPDAGPVAVATGAAFAASKLTLAAWLHTHWHGGWRSAPLRVALVCVLSAQMAMSGGLGAGFWLARQAHEASTGEALRVHLDQHQAALASANAKREAAARRLTVLDQPVTDLSRSGSPTRAAALLATQAGERAAIDADRRAAEAEVAHEAAEVERLRDEMVRADERTAPVRQLAASLGVADVQRAARLVASLLVAATDPAALLLTAAGLAGLARSGEALGGDEIARLRDEIGALRPDAEAHRKRRATAAQAARAKRARGGIWPNKIQPKKAA